jgi:PAS domain S-box-containing protein
MLTSLHAPAQSGSKQAAAFNQKGHLLNTLTASDGEIVFMMHARHPAQNFVSSNWLDIFGFDASLSTDLLSDQMACMSKKTASTFAKTILHLPVGQEAQLRYDITNRQTQQHFTLLQQVTKENDSSTGETILYGKISVVSKSNRNIHAPTMKKSLPSPSPLPKELLCRAYFEELGLAVMKVDRKENILWVNNTFAQLTGYTTEELIGQNAIQLFLNSSVETKKMLTLDKDRDNQKHSVYEVKMKKKDGTLMNVIINGSPVRDDKGNVIGTIGLHWDITKIRRLNILIEQEKAAMQQAAFQALVDAERQKSERLGLELRDTVGHMLTKVCLQLQKNIAQSPENSLSMEALSLQIKETLLQVETISQQLTPAGLHVLGLKDSIIELTNQLVDHQQTVCMMDCASETFTGIELHTQRAIYAMIEALIQNAVQHAHASLIKLQFVRSSDALIITCSDNGVGYDPKKVQLGRGLPQTNQTVRMYEGTIQIDTAPQKGTQCVISLPLASI